MAALKICVMLVLVGVASCANSGRIAGGSDAEIETYPTLAQIDFLTGLSWSQNCVGSILTSRYILSAAQCFSGLLFSPALRRVRVGSHYRNSGGEVYGIEEVKNHPNYGQFGHDADISVVRISGVLSYTNSIQPTTITAADSYLPANLPVTLVGWGDNEKSERSEVLQEVSTLTLDLATCQRRYESLNDPNMAVFPNMLCVGNMYSEEEAEEAQAVGACEGDVGSPVIYRQEPQYIVVGVYSFTYGCGHGYYPTVTTAITQFTDWILANAV